MEKNTLMTGIFATAGDAARAVSALEDGGIRRSDVNIVASEGSKLEAFGFETQSKAGKGAAIGGAAGVAVGALVAGFTAVGAIATGGVGLLVAGPIVAALAGAGAGAAAGGVVGGLIGWGIPEHQVKFYQDALEKGSVLVGVHVSSDQKEFVETTFKRFGAVSPTTSSAPAKAEPVGGNKW